MLTFLINIDHLFEDESILTVGQLVLHFINDLVIIKHSLRVLFLEKEPKILAISQIDLFGELINERTNPLPLHNLHALPPDPILALNPRNPHHHLHNPLLNNLHILTIAYKMTQIELIGLKQLLNG